MKDFLDLNFKSLRNGFCFNYLTFNSHRNICSVEIQQVLYRVHYVTGKRKQQNSIFKILGISYNKTFKSYKWLLVQPIQSINHEDSRFCDCVVLL